MKNWEFYQSVIFANFLMSMLILIPTGSFFHYKCFKFLYFDGLPSWLSIFIFSTISLIIPYLILSILDFYIVRRAKYKDGVVDLTFKESLSNVIHYLYDKRVIISLLLSVVGGLFGLFSLGTLYNRLYKRFFIEFTIGLLLSFAKIITCYNFVIGSSFDSIYYYNCHWLVISCIYVGYYLFTINDTYNCSLSKLVGKSNPFKFDRGFFKFLGSFIAMYLIQIGLLSGFILVWICMLLSYFPDKSYAV